MDTMKPRENHSTTVKPVLFETLLLVRDFHVILGGYLKERGTQISLAINPFRKSGSQWKSRFHGVETLSIRVSTPQVNLYMYNKKHQE